MLSQLPRWMWIGCDSAGGFVTSTTTRVSSGPAAVNVAVPVCPDPFCSARSIVTGCPSDAAAEGAPSPDESFPPPQAASARTATRATRLTRAMDKGFLLGRGFHLLLRARP